MKKLLMYTSYCWAYGLSAKGDRKTTAQSMVNVASAEHGKCGQRRAW
jgi:hypothetical protein